MPLNADWRVPTRCPTRASVEQRLVWHASSVPSAAAAALLLWRWCGPARSTSPTVAAAAETLDDRLRGD